MEQLFTDRVWLFIVSGFLVAIALSFIYGRRIGSAASSKALRARMAELENRIGSLSASNDEYMSFISKFAEAARLLNSNLSHKEVASAITRLLEDVIPSEFIGLYVYDMVSGSLKLTSAFGEIKNSKRVYLVGDGIVGAAAKNKVLLTSDTYRNHGDGSGGSSMPQIAVPVFFNDELLGVIYIRGVRAPAQNAKNLLAMISGMAGVSLKNAIFIDDAKQEASTDPLTGLYNRRFLSKRAAEELVRARGYSSPLSFFMFDIDNFKHYNDMNGHPEGDKLLVSLTELVGNATRKTSTLARYGGEEFLVLLPNLDKEEAFIYAERVRKLIEDNPFPHREKQPLGVVSISGGVSEFPSDGDTLDKLMQLADAALYRAKKDGRNRIVKA